MRPWPKGSPFEEHRRHRHDAARLDLLLEQRAVDHGRLDVRVEHRHQVERLHHVRAVVAGQRDEGLEAEAAFDAPDLRDQRLVDLGRMAAGLQQGEDQRGELVAHRQAGEVDARRLARAADRERRPALGLAVLPHADLRRQRGDVGEQFAHLGARRRCRPSEATSSIGRCSFSR
jgi:hypothetical protein